MVQKKTVFTTGGGGESYLIPTIVDVFDNYLVNHVIDKLLLTLGNSIYTFPYRLTQCTHSTLLSNSISVKYDVGTSGAQLTAPKRMSSVHREEYQKWSQEYKHLMDPIIAIKLTLKLPFNGILIVLRVRGGHWPIWCDDANGHQKMIIIRDSSLDNHNKVFTWVHQVLPRTA